MSDRGEKIDAALGRIQEVWSGSGKIGPKAAGAPRLVIGGAVEASFARAARFGEGWIAGGSGPEEFERAAEKVKAAWVEAGREGEPRLVGLAYFSLGEDGEENANSYLGDYYAWLGNEVSGMIAGSAAKDADTVGQYLAAYEAAGCDELIFFPSSADAEQVGLLAEAALQAA
jgi:alkanesulfonate monooxygenase SsuD/methylene tetrahydromethanopterin reductase-like flavin-dependent oxidoreductase (luciferase family)